MNSQAKMKYAFSTTSTPGRRINTDWLPAQAPVREPLEDMVRFLGALPGESRNSGPICTA